MHTGSAQGMEAWQAQQATAQAGGELTHRLLHTGCIHSHLQAAAAHVLAAASNVALLQFRQSVRGWLLVEIQWLRRAADRIPNGKGGQPIQYHLPPGPHLAAGLAPLLHGTLAGSLRKDKKGRRGTR